MFIRPRQECGSGIDSRVKYERVGVGVFVVFGGGVGSSKSRAIRPCAELKREWP